MAGMKTAAALMLAVCACAMVVIVHQRQSTAVVREQVQEAHKYGSPEADFVEVELESEGSMLDAIVNLRAYCALSIDVALDLKDEHMGADTALINFIINFGQDEAPNLVVAFAKAVGKTRAKFQAGIGDYFLNHISQAILKGQDVISFFNKDDGEGSRVMAQLDSEVLGLGSTPDYFDQLGVSAAEYGVYKTQLADASKDADTQAAVMWLKSGSDEEYRSFHQKEEDAVADKVHDYEEQRYMEALKAIKYSWGETPDLHPLPGAGGSAADVVVPPVLPSEDEIDAAAASAAATWKDEHDTGVDDLHAAAEHEIDSVEESTEDSHKEHEISSAVDAVVPEAEPEATSCPFWKYCSDEHGSCTTGSTDAVKVKYGASGSWAEQAITGSTACSNDVFGDPIPGTVKKCFVEEDIPCGGDWEQCSDEHGTCTFDGSKLVKYGADDNWFTGTYDGSVACSNDEFGDPLPGTVKACFIYDVPSSS